MDWLILDLVRFKDAYALFEHNTPDIFYYDHSILLFESYQEAEDFILEEGIRASIADIVENGQ